MVESAPRAAATASKTFLITGASSGLGLCIGLSALRAGHRVIGTARDVETATRDHPEFVASGGTWLQLDVTDLTATLTVSDCVQKSGVDVLVNNAGYGLYGALEDMSESEIRQQMEVNFFGTLRVIKAAIPHFRQQRSGVIVNMSSISGFTVTSASGIMYAATKFAIEAVSEGLVLQLSPFNIRVLLVEPGLFRTNWLAGSYVTPAAGLSEDYVGGPVDDALTLYPTLHNAQQGDPEKAAARIIEAVCNTGMSEGKAVGQFLRLPLGIDALEKARDKVENVTKNLDAFEEITRSTTCDDMLQ